MANNTGKKKSSTASKNTNLEMIGLESGKKPPQATEIEEAVLGALLLEPNAITEVMDVLTPECFYNEANRKIF